MADAGKHIRALADLALDTVAHVEESGRGLAHLGRARRLELGMVAALAEIVGGDGEAADRPHLVAHEQGCHRKEDERGADHPHHENIGRRTEQPLAWHEDLQHGVGQLDVDLNQTLVGLGVEDDRAADPVVELENQGAFENAVAGGLGHVGRQHLARFEGDLKVQVVARQLDDAGLSLRCGILVQQTNEGRNLAGKPADQPPSHGVPMAVVEDDGRDHLQQDQRGDDDQQRPAEQGARQQMLGRS